MQISSPAQPAGQPLLPRRRRSGLQGSSPSHTPPDQTFNSFYIDIECPPPPPLPPAAPRTPPVGGGAVAIKFADWRWCGGRCWDQLGGGGGGEAAAATAVLSTASLHTLQLRTAAAQLLCSNTQGTLYSCPQLQQYALIGKQQNNEKYTININKMKLKFQ